MTGIQRRFQAGRIFRFNGDHFDLRHQLFDEHRHACRQSTAANRHEYAVEMRILLEQFQRQRALPGNHHRMIERRNPGKALLLRQLDSFCFRFIKVRAVQQHFPAKPTHRVHFDIGGRQRHHNQCFHTQTRGGERHTLSMVTRRCGDNAVGFLFFGKPRHHRVGSAQLEAVYRLPVFTLHENNVVEARRKFFHFLQRRHLRCFIYRRAEYRTQVLRPFRGG